MDILKRNGRKVMFNPSNITKRIRTQSKDLDVDADALSIKVISQIAGDMTTRQLDELIVEAASVRVQYHPDYSVLASRIFVTSLRKYTPDTFSEAIQKLSAHKTIDQVFVNWVMDNKEELDVMIDQDRDFNHTIFGLKTLEKAYLMRDEAKDIVERPQYMWMRVAIEVTGYDILAIKATYDAMSFKYGTHATPTLFNSGTKKNQLSSCFLLQMEDDSIEGIYDTLKSTAKISQCAGGIGLSIHNVRAKGSHINGTNGTSNGIVPMLKVFNDTARYVDQGGGKRKGSFAIYLEPWHADIFDLLELKKNHGAEEMRARDLFYAMWLPDLFMERVRDNGKWSLFCPNEVLKATGKQLQKVTEEEFKELYEELEDMGIAMKTVDAHYLWKKIVESQIETGNPYMAYKDAVNRGSNQKNLGTIESSNLCIEINEFTSPEEQAVCNLASIALPMFVVRDMERTPHPSGKFKMKFDWVKFEEIVRLFVRNLNNVIDSNFYPTEQTEYSNNLHRPIGLGVQGLADVFAMMGYAFDSPEARVLNKHIFEAMYYYALKESHSLACNNGAYDSFDGSPASQGVLQFDFTDKDGYWDYEDSFIGESEWERLKNDICIDGLANSLLIALMPTASTSQILGFNECFEPFNSNLSLRRVLAGEFVVTNDHLIRDLEEIGLWNDDMRKLLMSENGSVQNIPSIPIPLKEKYRTAYEISMKSIIDMAADRQKFVCQAQSMNVFMTKPTIASMSSMHMYAWQQGLKTGMYYLRTKSAVDAKKFSLDAVTPIKAIEVETVDASDFKKMIEQSRNAQEDDDCLMCGS